MLHLVTWAEKFRRNADPGAGARSDTRSSIIDYHIKGFSVKYSPSLQHPAGTRISFLQIPECFFHDLFRQEGDGKRILRQILAFSASTGYIITQSNRKILFF